MNKPKGYDEAQAYTEQEALPVGGYVLKILDAKETTYTWGNVLVVRFDIAEGEYKDFYERNYKAQTQEDKKWKGTFRINLPKEDGSEKDGWTLRSLKTNMTAIENSNSNFRWEWDETKLKGNLVGGLFRRKEYEFRGKHGFFVECAKFVPAGNIRDGKFKIPEDKLLNKPANDIPEGMEPDDSDIPF